MRLLLEKIYGGNFAEFVNYLEKCIAEGRKRAIVTANPEIFYACERDKKLKIRVLSEDADIIADGISVADAAKRIGLESVEKIPGIDVVTALLKVANEKKLKVFFYGGSEETITLLEKKLEEIYPNLQICGLFNGYNYEAGEIMSSCAEIAPDIIIVALGVPVQEKLIFEYIDLFSKGIFIGAGGSLDIISGNKKRAPELFLKHNTEWLYRIVKEPSRINRFLRYNVGFKIKAGKLKPEKTKK